MLLEAA